MLEVYLQIFIQFAYPGVRDNRSTINTKTGYDITGHILIMTPFQYLVILVFKRPGKINAEVESLSIFKMLPTCVTRYALT